ncbi:hypothetical protein H4219_003812 [Mycoemilia scoparia]|uniref:Uncharacterized protein n=1 Tax=Mycoemilia scoparia TaxID=417184 RepID=A0A9W8A329_9FUNG|nr:hypothetical protein H4219_003812 [Mycoemilia scoparia]
MFGRPPPRVPLTINIDTHEIMSPKNYSRSKISKHSPQDGDLSSADTYTEHRQGMGRHPSLASPSFPTLGSRKQQYQHHPWQQKQTYAMPPHSTVSTTTQATMTTVPIRNTTERYMHQASLDLEGEDDFEFDKKSNSSLFFGKSEDEDDEDNRVAHEALQNSPTFQATRSMFSRNDRQEEDNNDLTCAIGNTTGQSHKLHAPDCIQSSPSRTLVSDSRPNSDQIELLPPPLFELPQVSSAGSVSNTLVDSEHHAHVQPTSPTLSSAPECSSPTTPTSIVDKGRRRSAQSDNTKNKSSSNTTIDIDTEKFVLSDPVEAYRTISRALRGLNIPRSPYASSNNDSDPKIKIPSATENKILSEAELEAIKNANDILKEHFSSQKPNKSQYSSRRHYQVFQNSSKERGTSKPTNNPSQTKGGEKPLEVATSSAQRDGARRHDSIMTINFSEDSKQGSLFDAEANIRSHQVAQRARKIEKLLGKDVDRSAIIKSFKRQDNMWYLGSTYDKFDISLDMEGRVDGGTWEALIEYLTPPGPIQVDYEIAFLLTFREFATPRLFCDALMRRYRIQPPEGIDLQQTKIWQEKKQRPVQLRVYQIIRSWYTDYWFGLEDDECLPRLTEFLSSEVSKNPRLSGHKLRACEKLISGMEQRMRSDTTWLSRDNGLPEVFSSPSEPAVSISKPLESNSAVKIAARSSSLEKLRVHNKSKETQATMNTPTSHTFLLPRSIDGGQPILPASPVSRPSASSITSQVSPDNSSVRSRGHFNLKSPVVNKLRRRRPSDVSTFSLESGASLADSTHAAGSDVDTEANELFQEALGLDISSNSYKNITSVVQLPPSLVAIQITILLSEYFCSIQPHELLRGEFSKKAGSMAVNVKKMSQWNTQLTRWVSHLILLEKTPESRCRMLKYFIQVGSKCMRLKNYDAVVAIQCALNSAAVLRLKKTWALLPSKFGKLNEEIQKATKSERNYRDYRAMVRKAEPPFLPFLGLYLTDLTFINDGNPNMRRRKLVSPVGIDDETWSKQREQENMKAQAIDTEKDGKDIDITSKSILINFDKHYKVAAIIREIQKFQVKYKGNYLVSTAPIGEYIVGEWTNIDTSQINEDVLYDMSLQREPREGMRQLTVNCNVPQSPSSSNGPSSATSLFSRPKTSYSSLQESPVRISMSEFKNVKGVLSSPVKQTKGSPSKVDSKVFTASVDTGIHKLINAPSKARQLLGVNAPRPQTNYEVSSSSSGMARYMSKKSFSSGADGDHPNVTPLRIPSQSPSRHTKLGNQYSSSYSPSRSFGSSPLRPHTAKITSMFSRERSSTSNSLDLPAVTKTQSSKSALTKNTHLFKSCAVDDEEDPFTTKPKEDHFVSKDKEAVAESSNNSLVESIPEEKLEEVEEEEVEESEQKPLVSEKPPSIEIDIQESRSSTDSFFSSDDLESVSSESSSISSLNSLTGMSNRHKTKRPPSKAAALLGISPDAPASIQGPLLRPATSSNSTRGLGMTILGHNTNGSLRADKGMAIQRRYHRGKAGSGSPPPPPVPPKPGNYKPGQKLTTMHSQPTLRRSSDSIGGERQYGSIARNLGTPTHKVPHISSHRHRRRYDTGAKQSLPLESPSISSLNSAQSKSSTESRRQQPKMHRETKIYSIEQSVNLKFISMASSTPQPVVMLPPGMSYHTFIKIESVETYWALTEYFVTKAMVERSKESEQQLVLNTLPMNRTNDYMQQAENIKRQILGHQALWKSHILKAITSLEVILQAETLRDAANQENLFIARFEITPLQSVLTRLRLAEILGTWCDNFEAQEFQLQKAVLIVERTIADPHWQNIVLMAQCKYLQQINNSKIAEARLKKAFMDAKSSDNFEWVYRILLELSQMYSRHDDMKSVINCLNHGAVYALRRNDISVHVCFQLEKAQKLLGKHEWNQMKSILDSIESVYSQQNSNTEPKALIGTIPHIRLCYVILKAIYLIHSGDTAGAVGLLQEAFGILNQWKQSLDIKVHHISTRIQQQLSSNAGQLSTEELYYRSQNIQQFKIDKTSTPTREDASGAWFDIECSPPRINSTTKVNPMYADRNNIANSESVQKAPTVSWKWKTPQEVYAVILVLYTLCGKKDSQSQVFEKQLDNARKSFNNGGQSLGHSASHDFLDANILLLRFDSELQSGQIGKAKCTLDEVQTKHARLIKDARLQDMVVLRIAMYHHRIGKRAFAINIYNQIARLGKERDTRVLAAVHQVMLLLGDNLADTKEVEKQVRTLEESSKYTQSTTLKAAIEMIRAVSCSEIVKSKEHMLRCLNMSLAAANTQLQSIALTFMASIFLTTHLDQSKNMAMAASNISTKSQDTLVGMLSGSLLEG